jgi:hypothetical protein
VEGSRVKTHLADIGGRNQVDSVGSTAVVLGQLQQELFNRNLEAASTWIATMPIASSPPSGTSESGTWIN